MMSMTSESEDRMTLKGSVSSPSIEEATAGGKTGGSVLLKKGPWTSAEDAILVDYVTKHGEGNWNAVQKHSGLARCGKSCRLRWANHLRPDLKKGAFTPEEERRIIELHAKMGNKWARMAAELPGRTDNEIKNYWNTRIKRRQRAGLPVYPPDLCLKSINASKQIEDMNIFSTGDMQHPDLFQINSFEIPAVEFKNLELNQHSYPPPALVNIPASSLLDITSSSLVGQGLKSSCGNRYFHSTVHPSKRLRGTETLFPGFSDNGSDFLPACSRFQSGNSAAYIAAQSFGVSSAYNQNLASDDPSLLSVIPGSHASLNGNSSYSSEPSWEKKPELPSLQSQMGSWYSPSSPLPSLESIDTLIQSPPPTEHTESGSLSPRNSGLLDAVLYESQTLKHSKNNNTSSQQTNSDASIIPGSIVDNSCPDLHDTEWEAYGEPISPLGHSSASVFSEYTPAVNGSSLDEPQTVVAGCKVKQEEEGMELSPMQCYTGRDDESFQNMFSRPDFLLASNSFGSQTEYSKNHCVLKEVFGAVLFDDFNSRDCKNMRTISMATTTSSGGSPCAWDHAMSTV